MGSPDKPARGDDDDGGGRPRRAVVLALTGAAQRKVDDIRRRWDPEMAARIDAHVTLLHDVADHEARAGRLARVAADRPPCEFASTRCRCWSAAPTVGAASSAPSWAGRDERPPRRA
ncbi:MAG: hypothetical protein H0W46_12760, partial [Acidimicrobiia bacterium]|nr:hypothetical protein [Acidimicrobiia bacterium]